MFLSTNNGTNWSQVNSGLTNKNITALADNGTDLIAGTYGGGVWIRPLSELTGVSNEIRNIPNDYALFQNYPNPFNPSTMITYSLPEASNVKLIVYNIIGQPVKVLENGYKVSGNYKISFEPNNLPSGIYFYKLEAGQFSQIKKMIYLK